MGHNGAGVRCVGSETPHREGSCPGGGEREGGGRGRAGESVVCGDFILLG